MKTFVAFGMFLLLIGQLTAEQSAELEEREEQEVESPLHNLVKRSTPKNYGYKATGKVKVGAPVVLKSPVYKQLTTYVQDGFHYTFPNGGGNLRGGNFKGGNVRGGNFGGGNFRGGNFNDRAGGYQYGYYPNGYQYPGGYPYGYYNGGYQYPYGYRYAYPNYYQNGYQYGYGSGNQYPGGKGGIPAHPVKPDYRKG